MKGLLHGEEFEGACDWGVRNRALVCDPVVQLVLAGQVEVGGARGDGLLGVGAVERLEENTRARDWIGVDIPGSVGGHCIRGAIQTHPGGNGCLTANEEAGRSGACNLSGLGGVYC